MARTRNIKPGFFTNESLAECSPLARLLFAGLWTIADKDGRLEDRPRKIKAEVLPYDDCDCNALLDELKSKRFITRYRADVDGEEVRIIQIDKFTDHQNPHPREESRSYPAPEKGVARPSKKRAEPESGTAEPRKHPAVPEKGCDEPGLLSSYPYPSNPHTSYPEQPSHENQNVSDIIRFPRNGNHEQKSSNGSAPTTVRLPPSNLPCHNPHLMPVVDKVLAHYQKSVAPSSPKTPKATQSVIALLNAGVDAKVLEQAAEHYADHCRRNATQARYRVSSATFYAEGGTYDQYLAPPPPDPTRETREQIARRIEQERKRRDEDDAAVLNARKAGCS